MTERAIADHEVVALEEQRDYLLKSIDDLEREYSAGDIDDIDYAELKDDYTARAAAMIRTIDARKARVAESGERGSRRMLWIGSIAAIAILAGVFIGQASGSRRVGEVGSGDIRASTRTLLLQADDALQNQNLDDAIELYSEVLEIAPSNAEALTYRAWVRYRQDPVAELALPDFADVIAAEPDYTDARVFNAIVLLEDQQPLEAAVQLKAFDASDPPPFMQSLVTDRLLRENIMLDLFGPETPVPIDQTAFTADEVVEVAKALVEQRQMFPEAQVLFDAVLRFDPNHVEAHTYAGWMLARLWASPQIIGGLNADELDEMRDSAFGFLDKAIELDPAYPDALVFRSFFLREQENIKAAAEDLNAFYALPEQPEELVALIADGDLDNVLE